MCSPTDSPIQHDRLTLLFNADRRLASWLLLPKHVFVHEYLWCLVPRFSSGGFERVCRPLSLRIVAHRDLCCTGLRATLAVLQEAPGGLATQPSSIRDDQVKVAYAPHAHCTYTTTRLPFHVRVLLIV